MFQLSGTDIERIDATSLRILEELGIRVDDEDLRRKALAAGARPGRSADWIRLPPAMVRQYVAMAPSKANYADRDGHVTGVGPGKPSTYWTGAALNYVRGRESSAITSADLAEFTRIVDATDSAFAVVGTSLADVPPGARDVVGLRIMATHTRKHLRPLLFKPDNVPAMIEIGQILAAGKPLAECPVLSFGYSCLSPLHWSHISSDLWRLSSGHRIPVMLNGEPIAGATSPVTLAGSVALSNAEILAGVVLVQLLEQGRPVVHNLGFAHCLDMRTAACLSGSPECAIMAWAGARLAEFYNLPSASWMCTDSMLDDEQSSMEKMLTGLAHALGGVGVIWGMGQLETEKTLSPVQLVMDHEVVLALGRLAQGMPVDEESLAFEAVRDVVEKGEQFMTHDHTLAHFRRELSESPLLNRVNRQVWLSRGGLALAERAQRRVEEILAAPAKDYLSDRQRKDIARVEDRVLKGLK